MIATRKTQLAIASLLMTAIAIPSPSASALNYSRPNRSIYLPIAFSLCPHLKEASLYIEGQAVGVLPAERIFQFTYYPSLKRVEPHVIQIQVRGRQVTDGAPFLARLALTLGGIHTAREHRPLDLSRQTGELRYKLDTRHAAIFVMVRCQAECGADCLDGNGTPVRADSGGLSSITSDREPD